MQMSFQSLLLSTFAKGFNFTGEINSIRKRYRVLSIVVTNFLLLFLCLCFEIIVKYCSSNGTNYLVAISGFIAGFCSLFFLRIGDDQMAANVTMSHIHIVFFIISIIHNVSLAPLCGLVIFPNYCMLLDLPQKSILFHIFVGLLGAIYYLFKVYDSFQIMLSDNQSLQIIILIICIIYCFIHFIIICIAEKRIEESTWQLASKNFEKSEKLTNEIMKLMEAKDAFISSLSCEMKNSLSSIKEGLKYLTQVIKKPSHLEELKTIDLNIEVLYNMITNMEPNQNGVSSTITNSSQLIEKSFSFHANNMRKKNTFTQAFVDKRLPKDLWIDAPRVLQITINLLSTALERTISGGKVKMYFMWCTGELNHEELIKPTAALIDQNSPNQTQNNITTTTVQTVHMVENREDGGFDTQSTGEFTEAELMNRLQKFRPFETSETKSLEGVNNAPEALLRHRHWTIHKGDFSQSIFYFSNQPYFFWHQGRRGH